MNEWRHIFCTLNGGKSSWCGQAQLRQVLCISKERFWMQLPKKSSLFYYQNISLKQLLFSHLETRTQFFRCWKVACNITKSNTSSWFFICESLWASDVLWTSNWRLYEVRTSYRRPLDVQRTPDAHWGEEHDLFFSIFNVWSYFIGNKGNNQI